MKNVLICEGSTDYALLQYYMIKVNAWNDSKKTILKDSGIFQRVRTLVKNDNTLSIGGAGGCSQIIPCLEFILKSNRTCSQKEDIFEKIVIVTDRDECGTEADFIVKIQDCLAQQMISTNISFRHNAWMLCQTKNLLGKDISFSILLLVVPFETEGAMETFLLDSIANSDSYDANIINGCRTFVDNIDVDKKYLNKRRYITKAKFDVYFSVRTAAEQFNERRDILKNVPWEQYISIQSCFEKLSDI